MTEQLQLQPRLRLLADLVPQGARLADIGTDHGYLPVYLLQRGRIASAIAADIGRAPLDHARRTAEQYGVECGLRFLCCDGLCGISPEDADTVVIAGMGGELIADILSRWDYTENPTVTYLLQPMTRPVHLRQWLYAHRFTLQEERCCRANGKLYSVMRAQYTGCPTEETPTALYYGALDFQNDPLAGDYRAQVLGRLQRRITGLVEAKPTPERDEELTRATNLLLTLR